MEIFQCESLVFLFYHESLRIGFLSFKVFVDCCYVHETGSVLSQVAEVMDYKNYYLLRKTLSWFKNMFPFAHFNFLNERFLFIGVLVVGNQ